jgi:hypothetical protein
MKKIIFILFLGMQLSLLAENPKSAPRDAFVPVGGARLLVQVDNNNDTIFQAYLRDVWIFPKERFRSKKQEQFYWRTVRDVKRTLPYAKLISSELLAINIRMLDLPNERERKRYLNTYEKEAFKKYEKDLRKMTINQGKMLIKLIDRECDKSAYELLKSYRGGISATFWQGMARLFGSNLKADYDAQGNDRIVERVILLVESGQL